MSEVTFVVEHKDQSLVATLPVVFDALSRVLPLASKLFGSKKNPAVNSRDLHETLKVSRNHSTWLTSMFEKFDFVEGVDYVVERIDKNDQSQWDAIKANNGKTLTAALFTPKAAALIALMTRNEIGKQVFDYMYAVVDAAQDAIERLYIAQLKEVKEDLRLTEKLKNQFADEVTTLAKAQGFTSASSWEQQLQLAERSRKINDQRVEATNGALLLWEQASRALRALKNGQNNAAKMELQQVLDKYGMYDDFLRDNPPWSQHND